MRQRSTVASVLALLVLVAACSDTPTTTTQVDASNKPASGGSSLGTCTTLSALTSLANQIFGKGSPNVNSVLGKLSDFDKFVQKGDVAQSQSHANDIVSFVQKLASSGRLAGSPSQVDAFIGGVLCYAGLSPNTYLVQPSDAPQVITTNTGNSGISLPGNSVSVPTLITITELDPNGPSPLITKLDQYPTYISVTTTSPLNSPAVVAVCIGANANVPPGIFNRLRLGHQGASGFEITPAADPSFLGCPTSLSSSSRMPKWLRTVASIFLPKKLYARSMFASTGGVGGSSTEFSPFGAVDDGLFATGGVGGSSTEFQLGKPTPNQSAAAGSSPTAGGSATTLATGRPAFSVYDAQGNCISADTTVGKPLSVACRPLVNITTGKGTVLTGVPVAWAVTAGGGTIAADALADNSCGTFGAAASNATNVNGKAAVCWTMGATSGTNTVTATPSPGGDAPNGVYFLNSSGTQETGVQFTSTADLIPTTASATGASVPYDGSPHAGAGSCSNGATPTMAYNTTGGNAPVDAGSYTLTVTCNAGSNIYAQSSNTAAITISPASSSTNVSCPSTVAYNGSTQNPCTATATGANLNVPVTVSYSPTTVKNAGGYTASATFNGDANHTGSNGSKGFTITQLAATATAGSGSIHYGASAPALPCVVGGLLAADAGTVTCTTSVPSPLAPGANVTTPNVSPASPANYAVTPVNGSLTARYVQSECFEADEGVFASAPSTSNGVNRGTTVFVECDLQSNNGAEIPTAVGNLTLTDMGTNAAGPGVVALTVNNAWSRANDQDGDNEFSYSLNTSSLTSGHYYTITASWDDGSTSTGWIYVKAPAP